MPETKHHEPGEDQRLSLEQALALTTYEIERIWSYEAFEYAHAFWQWGLFQLKDEFWHEANAIDGRERPGFRFSDDRHEMDWSIHYCWVCEEVQIDPYDDLGLCAFCIDLLKWPEKTKWRRERHAYPRELTGRVGDYDGPPTVAQDWGGVSGMAAANLIGEDVSYYGVERPEDTEVSGEGYSTQLRATGSFIIHFAGPPDDSGQVARQEWYQNFARWVQMVGEEVDDVQHDRQTETRENS